MAHKKSKFYKDAANYWANVPATLDGVLGGYGHISAIDIEGSKAFLNHLFSLENPPAKGQALDCGAGIGRVSTLLLMPVFEKVDLVDQDEKFTASAQDMLKYNTKLGTIYTKSLQSFKPDKQYDLIWCQWVLGHLKDYDLIDFLKICRKALSKNGVIVIKENITADKDIEFDEDDSSVTRPYDLMRLIFEKARLVVIKECVQTDFPNDIYPVYMFALVPSTLQ